MRKITKIISVGLMVWGLTVAGWTGEKRWTLDVEGGMVVSGYNDVQIPRDTGTRFSLKNDLDIANKFYYRLRLSLNLGRRHALSLLYAPLSLDATGMLPGDVVFEGVLFPGGTPVNALYRFDSYRLTYRYLLVKTPKLDLWIGFTGKIRDAEITLESAAQSSSKTNTGFVPLLHLSLDWKWNKNWGLLFEADAAAAKQGRAEDVALAIYYDFDRTWSLKAGYRIVEGGADVEEVYNFALINYFFAGVILKF